MSKIKTTAIYINEIPIELKHDFDIAVAISGKKQKKVIIGLISGYVKANSEEIGYIKKQRNKRAGKNE